MIKGESSDWCGINETFVFHSDIEDSEVALENAIDIHEDAMGESLYKYYTQDEDDEDFIANPSYSFSIEKWIEEEYGSHDAASYIQLK